MRILHDMKKLTKTLTERLFQFLQLQLFLSLASLPILVAWGIPFSAATAIGNFIFSPFLTAFLCCSSLIFFTELLSIPNGFLLYLLETISNLWFFLLSYGSKEWMIGIKFSLLPLVLLCAIIGFIVLQHRVWGRRNESIIALSLLTIIATVCLPLLSSKTVHTTITCAKKTISVFQDGNVIFIDDNGALASKISPSSWIQFTFIPELIKATGNPSIKKITVRRTNSFALEALIALCTHTQVKQIELAYFETLSKYGWRLFYELKRLLEKEQIKLVRINTP